MADRLSDERHDEIAVFAAALPNSMAYVYGCFEDLLAEVGRLRQIEEAALAWRDAVDAERAMSYVDEKEPRRGGEDIAEFLARTAPHADAIHAVRSAVAVLRAALPSDGA